MHAIWAKAVKRFYRPEHIFSPESERKLAWRVLSINNKKLNIISNKVTPMIHEGWILKQEDK